MTIGYIIDVIWGLTLPVRLFQQAAQFFRCPLLWVNLLEVQSVELVGLDSVKRTENQTFHLQLVDAVQLCLNAWTKTERMERTKC